MRRPTRILAGVTISFVVLVVASELGSGGLVGRVTDVDAGVTTVFRTADELVAFLHGAAVERSPARAKDDA